MRKKKYKLRTVLNVQIVMTRDNVSEILLLGRKVKKLGADNYIVKSVGSNPLMRNKINSQVDKFFFTEAEEIRQGVSGGTPCRR